jgi:putative restriction endonuclease
MALIMNDAAKWLAKLAKLNVYRAKGGPAPHKPLLLLVIFELAEQGLLPTSKLRLTPELAFRFCTYWNIIAHRRTQKPDVRLPFHHLHGDGIWTALGEDETPSPHVSVTRQVAFNPGFRACVHDPAFRTQGIRILISNYFQPDERVALYTLLGLPVPTEDEAANSDNDQTPEQARERGRETRFRLSIVSLYSYTCALTGYCLLTVSSGTMIDAAHIHQFADPRNNDPQNGLALCKNAHWLFDNGLWTLADDFTVLVAVGHFTEDSPDQKALLDYHGQRIRLPNDPRFHPHTSNLAWHRKHKFQG